MPRILLVAATTGYQTRMFGDAAARAGVELVFATDRCTMLDDPWRDGAIAIRFYDEERSLAAIRDAVGTGALDGVLALGDRSTVVAARVAAELGLPFHPPAAARAASNKLLTRRRFEQAGLGGPWYRALPLDTDATAVSREVAYPCVLKPLVLSASRGVVRVDRPEEMVQAWARLTRLLRQADVRAQRDPDCDVILVEGFIPGREFALEGVLEQGELRVLALFDKPDPLDGPFFEETIYTTPSRLPAAAQDAIVEEVRKGARALGLWHGPIHAECRVNDAGVFLLEIAARPIGGLCARTLWFRRGHGTRLPLEEVLLRHAAGEPVARYPREEVASGVMMVPIPRAGFFKGVEGVEDAMGVEGITEVRITAKRDQRIDPLPDGASYLGFIFARADSPDSVEAALRAAHRKLRVLIAPAPPVV